IVLQTWTNPVFPTLKRRVRRKAGHLEDEPRAEETIHPRTRPAFAQAVFGCFERTAPITSSIPGHSHWLDRPWRNSSYLLHLLAGSGFALSRPIEHRRRSASHTPGHGAWRQSSAMLSRRKHEGY